MRAASWRTQERMLLTIALERLAAPNSLAFLKAYPNAVANFLSNFSSEFGALAFVAPSAA